jgi:hypothetical protein
VYGLARPQDVCIASKHPRKPLQHVHVEIFASQVPDRFVDQVKIDAGKELTDVLRQIVDRVADELTSDTVTMLRGIEYDLISELEHAL